MAYLNQKLGKIHLIIQGRDQPTQPDGNTDKQDGQNQPAQGKCKHAWKMKIFMQINTHAFLGYPVLQAADILLYRAELVPVGNDQLPHLELTREIVRRFSNIYKSSIFPEPKPILTLVPRLLGLDGRKMSKSYGNSIYLSDEDSEIKEKVRTMFTDPKRIRKTDPGHPEVCNVYSYYKAFFDSASPEVHNWCTKAERGCTECKSILAGKFCDLIQPKREEKKGLLKNKDKLMAILEEGRKKASIEAEKTWLKVREAVKI